MSGMSLLGAARDPKRRLFSAVSASPVCRSPRHWLTCARMRGFDGVTRLDRDLLAHEHSRTSSPRGKHFRRGAPQGQLRLAHARLRPPAACSCAGADAQAVTQTCSPQVRHLQTLQGARPDLRKVRAASLLGGFFPVGRGITGGYRDGLENRRPKCQRIVGHSA